MKGRSFIYGIILISLFIAVCIYPVSATSSDISIRGIVSNIDQVHNKISINTTTEEITAEVPSSVAFYFCDIGTHVMAVINNGSDSKRWISIATLRNDNLNKDFTDYINGDPTKVSVLFEGNYSVNITVIPDCTRCNGSICQAAYANISLKRYGKTVSEPILYPDVNGSVRSNKGFSYTDPDPHDHSQIFISFISGEVNSEKCGGNIFPHDPPPVQVFEIHYLPHYSTMESYPNDSLWSLILVALCIFVIGILAFNFRNKNQ
jgi:hypothetical protein